jgi:hypothetical protein
MKITVDSSSLPPPNLRRKKARRRASGHSATQQHQPIRNGNICELLSCVYQRIFYESIIPRKEVLGGRYGADDGGSDMGRKWRCHRRSYHSGHLCGYGTYRYQTTEDGFRYTVARILRDLFNLCNRSSCLDLCAIARARKT